MTSASPLIRRVLLASLAVPVGCAHAHSAAPVASVQVAVFRADGDGCLFERVNAATGDATRVARLDGDCPGLEWNADGSRALLVSFQRLREYVVATGAITDVPLPDIGEVQDEAFDRQGALLAVTVGAEPRGKSTAPKREKSTVQFEGRAYEVPPNGALVHVWQASPERKAWQRLETVPAAWTKGGFDEAGLTRFVPGTGAATSAPPERVPADSPLVARVPQIDDPEHRYFLAGPEPVVVWCDEGHFELLCNPYLFAVAGDRTIELPHGDFKEFDTLQIHRRGRWLLLEAPTENVATIVDIEGREVVGTVHGDEFALWPG